MRFAPSAERAARHPRVVRGSLRVLALAALAVGATAPSAWATRTAGPTFTALPAAGATELGTPRYDAVAAPLPGGNVLILGGRLPWGSAAGGAERFNAATDTFTELTAPGAWQEAVAAPLPGGRVLIAGGSDADPLLPTDDTLAAAVLFGPASDTLVRLPASGHAEMRASRAGAIAAPLPDGDVLIAGGVHSGTGPPGTAAVTLRSAERFDPATDRFTALRASGATELVTARAGAVAAPLPDGDVLIAGGSGAHGAPLRSAELFHPATGTFTALPASGATELVTARIGAVAAPLRDGRVLIAGGYDGADTVYRSAELFDPACDTFSELPALGATELQTPRWGAVAAPLPDGRVLIAGGNSSAGAGDPAGAGATAELFSEGAASAAPPRCTAAVRNPDGGRTRPAAALRRRGGARS